MSTTITKNSSEASATDRLSESCEVSNYRDVLAVRLDVLSSDKIRRTVISGVVDTGTTRLVLPSTVAKALGVPPQGRINVKLADGRQEQRDVVGDVHVKICDRSSVFTAVVEPGRNDASIGTIVLQELDLIPDGIGQHLVPRDPHGMLAEIE